MALRWAKRSRLDGQIARQNTVVALLPIWHSEHTLLLVMAPFPSSEFAVNRAAEPLVAAQTAANSQEGKGAVTCSKA